MVNAFERLDNIQAQIRTSVEATATAYITSLRAETVATDAFIKSQQEMVAQLGSVGTSALDRRIQTTPSGTGKEDLQIERLRQGNQQLADQVHTDTLKMIDDVDTYQKKKQEEAATVTKAYQEEIAAVTSYMTAVQNAATTEREQLSTAAGQFAPRVKSYQEVTEQIILEGVALQNLATTERESLATNAAQFAPKVKSYQEVTTLITAQIVALSELATAERTQLSAAASQFAPKVKSYQEVTTLIGAQMIALNELAATERSQLAGEASKFAPRVKSYQEVTTAIHAQIAAMIELDRQEAKTFEDEMRASLKAADTEIEANQRVLQSFREKRVLEADTAPQRAIQAQADVYDKYYAPAVNRASESSLGFVRSITGLVSASNLLGVSGNNAALNILTMSASFDRLGASGLALGGGIGIILAGIGSLIGAYNTLRQGATDLIGAIVGVTEALIQQGAAGFQSAVKAAADYQQQLAFIAGLLKPTTTEFEALNAKVESVSQTTVFGMGKATEAVSELARAGNSLTEIINQGALDAVVNLAQAANGELSLGDAAKAVTSIVGAYTQVIDGVLTKTVDYTRATDALTGTAQLSRLSFLEVMQAWRQAAPIAAATKISVEDLGTVIAILANASETGSISGTALKQVILDLEKPSKAATEELNKFGVSLFTVDGNVRPFRDVVLDLNRAFGEQALAEGKVTKEEQLHALAVIFGSRAALAANILTNQGAEAFDRMRASMEGVKTVDLANVMLLPLNARMEIFQHSLETVGIALAGPFLTGFSDIINAGIKLAQSIPLDTIRLFGQAIVAVATNEGVGVLRDKLEELASGNALQFFNSLVTFGLRIREAFTEQILPAIEAVAQRILDFATSDTGLDQMARAFDTLGNVVLFVGGVIANFIVSAAGWVEAFLRNEDAIRRVINVAEGLAAVIVGTLAVSFVALAVPITLVTDMLANLGAAVDPVLGNFASLVTGAQDTGSAVGGSFAAMQDSVYGLVDASDAIVGPVSDSYEAIATVAVDTAEAVIGASDAQTDGVIAAMNDQLKGEEDGWNSSVEITRDSVQNVTSLINSLEKPFENLERAPQNVGANWAAMFNQVLKGLQEFAQNVINGLNQLLSAMASNPLFASIPLIGIPAIAFAEIKAGVAAVGTLHTAWDGVNEAIDRIGRVSIPEITRRSRDSTGELRSLLDNLGALRGGEGGVRPPLGGADTTGAPYPGAGGGGGGGRGGGGAGRGAGAGPEAGYNRALDQAEEFANDLSTKIQKAGQQALEKLEDINTKFEAAMLIEAREYTEKRAAIISKADEEHDTIVDNFNQSRADRALRKSLDDQLKLESQTSAFEKQARDYRTSDAREAEDRLTASVNSIVDRGLTQRQTIEATARSRRREDEDTAYKRAEDDTEAHLRKLEELQAKHTERQTQAQQDAIRGGINLGFSRTILSGTDLEKRQLDRQRANEDKDTKRSRSRADEDYAYTLQQQNEVLDVKDERDARAYTTTVRRRNEDRATQHQDVLDDAAFTERQANVRQSLEDKIEVDGIIRRLQAIQKDRDLRLGILDREHGEREDKIKAAAEQEARDVLGTLNNQLQDVQRTINDKAPEIIKTGGEAMQPIMDAIVQNLQDQMEIVYNAASDAREQLGLAVGSEGAQSISETVIDSMADAISTYTAGMVLLGIAAHDAAAEIFNAMGKPVPGEPITVTTPGLPDTTITPQPVLDSIPNNNGVPLPSTSNVIAPSGTGDTTVTNNTTYNVDANYGATQSPASIGLDLSAIAAIGRG